MSHGSISCHMAVKSNNICFLSFSTLTSSSLSQSALTICGLKHCPWTLLHLQNVMYANMATAVSTLTWKVNNASTHNNLQYILWHQCNIWGNSHWHQWVAFLNHVIQGSSAVDHRQQICTILLLVSELIKHFSKMPLLLEEDGITLEHLPHY